MKKKLLLISFGLLAFVIFSFLAGPILILDSKSYLPITGASINFKTDGWNGCIDASEKSTTLGIATSFGLAFRCQIKVSKAGYHTNGINYPGKYSGFFRFHVIKLNPYLTLKSR